MIIGHMVTRNEADRYLPAVLEWHKFLDALHVYDDQSTDDTPVLCENAGALVSVRPEGVPSFSEHEGAFRQAAWDDFVQRLVPSEDDWVVALDADEFYMTQATGTGLIRPVSNARSMGVKTLYVQVFEVFGWDERDGAPMYRTDGFWGDLWSPRVFQFQPGGRFRQDNLGCGSCPTYIADHPSVRVEDVAILHYGYAKPEDRLPKYNKYYNDPGNNHHKDHIMSIVGHPTVDRWPGEVPVRG